MRHRAEFMPPRPNDRGARHRTGTDLPVLRTVERTPAPSGALAGALDEMSAFLRAPTYRRRRIARAETAE